jgi:TonB family protein
VRLLVTLAALAWSSSGWSANLGPCSNEDAAAGLAKFRQYVMPAPDAPQHRWMVSRTSGNWQITEYNSVLVFVRCKPVTKADQLNGVMYGEVEFRHEVSRTTPLPELTSAGLKWKEWSQWTDTPKPLTKAQEAEAGPLAAMVHHLTLSERDRRMPFRKYKGKFQFNWEYSEDAEDLEWMPAADVKKFLATADAEAAQMRLAEAEQAKRAAEEAQQVKASQALRNLQLASTGAKLTRPVDPDAYYPPGSRRREEQGAPTVRACVGPNGRLLRHPELTDTSGFPELDDAAIKVATASRYSPAVDERGAALPESCVKFRVKFSINQP